jgi:tetratricopeptide (TPR) repeat protein
MVALTETTYHADPKDQRAQYDYGMSLTRLADMLPHEKAKPEAIETYRKAFGLFEQISLRDRRNRRVFYQMATTLKRMGDWQQTTGDLRAAEREYRRAAAMDVRLLEEDSSDFERVGNLQRSHRALSALLAKAGNCESAMQVHRSAIALLQPVAAKLPNELRALALEPQMSKHLGDLHTQCGDTSAARQAYETSVQQWAPLKSHKNFGKAQRAEARDAEGALAKWKR